MQLFQEAPEGTYDTILMDMQMPIMNGLQAAAVIRSFPMTTAKKIPIIALTANAYQEDAKKCREAGMNDHLSKPVQVEQILVTVEKYLSRSGKNEVRDTYAAYPLRLICEKLPGFEPQYK